jgi:hypothetical protein
MYELRYHPDTDLGRRFPHWVIATFRTYEAAVAVRQQCASAASIEVVESGESSSRVADSGRAHETMGVAKREPDRVNESDSLATISTQPKGA